jgi:hypothetical protein
MLPKKPLIHQSQFHKVTGHKLHNLQIDEQGMKEFAKGGFAQQELYLNFQFFLDNPSGVT